MNGISDLRLHVAIDDAHLYMHLGIAATPRHRHFPNLVALTLDFAAILLGNGSNGLQQPLLQGGVVADHRQRHADLMPGQIDARKMLEQAAGCLKDDQIGECHHALPSDPTGPGR